MELPAEIDLSALRDACRSSRSSLEDFRRTRTSLVKSYAGGHYSKETAGLMRPVNLIALYVSTMTRSLVPKEPRVMLTTFDAAQRAAVEQMQEWVNVEIQETDIDIKFRTWVFDALFSSGFLKVALATPTDAALAGWNLSAGVPTVSVVDMDDIVLDLHARRFDECEFVGHRYRVPVSVANDIYNRNKRNAFQATENQDTNSEGDYRVNVLARGTGARDEFEEKVDLWEIWLRRSGLVLTLIDDGGLPADGTGKDAKGKKVKPLAVQKWIGPYCGPYHYLNFKPMPGNVMGGSPLMDLVDLDRGINEGFVKYMEDAANFKAVGVYKGNLSNGAARIRNAGHGEWVEYDGQEAPQEVVFRAPSEKLGMAIQQMHQFFELIGGNISLMGGRAAASRTASQDKMLNENAGVGVADLQGTVLSAISKVFKALNWFYWYHPQKVMKSTKLINGEFPIHRTLHPYNPQSADHIRLFQQGASMRQGPMPLSKIDPYSLAHTTPQTRSAFLSSVVAEMAPMMAILQQTGIMFDPAAYLELKAKLGDEPDIQRIFKYQEPPAPAAGQPAGSNGSQPKMGPMPNQGGEYTRISVGQDSPAARANDMRTRMMAGAASSNGDGGGE